MEATETAKASPQPSTAAELLREALFKLKSFSKAVN